MTNNITENLKLYKSLFHTRDDVFARYWESIPKKKAGYTPVFRINQKPQALTDQILLSHLNGEQIIGVYPLFPDNTTSFLAIDLDGSDWMSITQKIVKTANLSEVPLLIERSKSGNGAHLWLFFDQPIPAYKARQLGKFLLSQTGITNRHTFDRMFPSQDEHTGKGYGNLICLPLSGKFEDIGNTVFIDGHGIPFPDQWDTLRSAKRITIDEIDKLVNISTIPKIAPKRNDMKTPDRGIKSDDEADHNVTTTQGQEVRLVLNSGIFIPSLWLPDKLYRYLKKELNFPNPEFYAKERFGYSTWQTPRFIKTLELTTDGVIVPMGFLGKLTTFIKQENLTTTIEDQRIITKSVSFASKLSLRKEQQSVLRQLTKHNRVILEANPGFGKTMVALALMRKLKQKTLIIVHTNTLLHQWHKRLADYFNLTKEDVGLVGDNKWQIGEKITIASYMTLYRRDLEDIANEFGLIIVDECHHVPANTFSHVVRKLSAKYMLGLTATTFRKDKLEKLMTLYVADQIVTAIQERSESSQVTDSMETQLITRKTQFKPDGKVKDFQEASRLVIVDKERNNQIATDIADVLSTGAKCLVLSERLEHCETLLDLVRQKIKGVHAAVATGIMTKKQRERIAKRLYQKRFQLLIATGKLIGEGFDWPEVSHLFLAFPFSWKGKLIQYIGRVQRPNQGKAMAVVHDYFDDQVPMLKIMYFKRLRTCRSLGLSKISSPVKKKNTNEDQLSLF